jgi:hypothetical protein
MFQLRRTHSNLFGDEHMCNRLVFYERFSSAARAIRRKEEIDRASRSEKAALIASVNPGWLDLYGGWDRVARQMSGQGKHPGGRRWPAGWLRRVGEAAVRLIAAL